MNELHIFSGGGLGILGGMLLGHTCVCAVEIEPYCRKVLLQRQRDGILPKFPIWDDVRTFEGQPWRGKIDIICAGIPCQKVSAAGEGGGFLEQDYYISFKRVVCEVRPKHLFLENSPMLSVRGLFGLLRDISKMGYNARWGVLGTVHAGGHCQGLRMWIVAKTATFGWGEILRFDQIGGGKTSKLRASVNVDSCRRIDRIHALEQMAGQPAILGSNDGSSNRVDRLHVLGNGQFPKLVKLAWETLSGS